MAATSTRDLLRSRNLWWENLKLKVDSIERTLLLQPWDHRASYLEITIHIHKIQVNRTRISSKVLKTLERPLQIQLSGRSPKFLLKNAQQLSVSKIWANLKRSQSLRPNPFSKDLKVRNGWESWWHRLLNFSQYLLSLAILTNLAMSLPHLFWPARVKPLKKSQ